jgi:two-component sensor histidine kinase
VKHGALTVAEGRVLVTWNVGQDGAGRRHLNLLWREVGGPTVCHPEQTGFGTRLIRRSFEAEPGGKARLVYDPAGLQCVIEMALSSPEEIPMER